MASQRILLGSRDIEYSSVPQTKKPPQTFDVLAFHHSLKNNYSSFFIIYGKKYVSLHLQYVLNRQQ
jgi:hypothetical protein